MNTENSIIPSHDDVVFENRNKAYGAYTIRKSYESNLSRGSAASFLFFGVVLTGLYATALLKPGIIKQMVKPPTTDLATMITIIPERPVEPVKPQVRHESTFPTRVVQREVIDPPTVEPLVAPNTGGPEGPGTDAVPSIGNGTQVPTEPVIAVKPPQTLDIAEVMPEFEGGAKALYKYLRKTLRYPKAAARVGQEGVVYVRFVIDVTGSVTGVEVIKNVSGVLDNEASRVIGLMPKWKPGSQHGEPVNVRMVLPIKFELNNE